jgi:microcystin-dependent protein
MSVTQVQTSGITDDAVINSKIGAGAVGNTEIAAGAVTTTKINFETALVPVGGIIMWSGTIAQIANLSGWELCDGNNGTPDLRDRFVIGATTDGSDNTFPRLSVNQRGGSADATLVSHTHTVTSSSAAAGGGFKAFFISINRILRFPPNDAIDSMASGTSTGDFSDQDVAGVPSSSVGRGSLSNAGSSATNANLPPYWSLAFIMRVS